MVARWPPAASVALQSRVQCLHLIEPNPGSGSGAVSLMEERYHRHSTIITTNLVYDEWQNFLGNSSMVEALLSRVRHYCHTVTINGPSLREAQG